MVNKAHKIDSPALISYWIASLAIRICQEFLYIGYTYMITVLYPTLGFGVKYF